MPDLVTCSNNRSDSPPGYYLKLQFKYFLVQVFIVTAFAYPVPEMYGCCVLFENIIEMRVFTVIYL